MGDIYDVILKKSNEKTKTVYVFAENVDRAKQISLYGEEETTKIENVTKREKNN
jgi:hypothetical protein